METTKLVTRKSRHLAATEETGGRLGAEYSPRTRTAKVDIDSGERNQLSSEKLPAFHLLVV